MVTSLVNEVEGELALPSDHNLVFFVTSDWNIYPNFSEIAPWWKLGNLKVDTWPEILSRYVDNYPLGLEVMTTCTNKELASQYGDPLGEGLYLERSELVDYYIAKACRDSYPFPFYGNP